MRGKGGRRAVAGSGDRLARRVRSHVAGGEQALALGSHPDVRGDAPVLVQGNDPLEHLGVRETTDVREDPRNGKGRRRPPSRGRARGCRRPVRLRGSPRASSGPDLDLRALPHATAVRLLPREGLAGWMSTTRTSCRTSSSVSTSAESPSPHTATSLPRYSGPSQLAHVLSPLPSNSSSRGTPSLRGLDPVATMTAAAPTSPASVTTLQSPPRGSMRLTSLISNAPPASMTCSCIRGPSSKPGTPSGKPGKSSTRSVFRIAPARAERIEQHRAPAVPRGEERCGEPGRPSARYCDLVVRHALAQPTSAHPGGATPGKSSTSSSISAIAVDTRPQR